MGRIRVLAIVVAALAGGAVLLSGGSEADPSTPAAAPGQPTPFLGTAVVGSGGLTAAVDAYGDIVDLRLPGPAGEAQISIPFERQAAGSVAADSGIVPAVGVGPGEPLPLWRGTGQRQSYLPGTNLLRTSATVAGARVRIADAAGYPSPELARTIAVSAHPHRPLRLRLGVNLDLAGDAAGDELVPTERGFAQSDGRRARCTASPRPDHLRRSEDGDAAADLLWSGRGSLRVGLSCSFESTAGADPLAAAVRDRRWSARARSLGATAPGWARRMYARSLLVLRALQDRRSGAVAAGARDGWAYVWPRDAGAAVLALAAAGYPAEAGRGARFLLGLDLGAAARFHGDGSPLTDGRELPGDSAGWVRAAALAAGLGRGAPASEAWRGRGDYGERAGDSGDYLANAIAAGVPAHRIERLFATRAGLVRRAGDPGSGLDTAAAWAVRPFARPPLFGAVGRTLRRLVEPGDRFGIAPSADWPHDEAWSAPTAWSAWSLAALGDRRGALHLLRMLRRAGTGAGMLPERAGPSSGLPRSTTPLAWSHAFAVLALRELYPGGPMRQASVR